MTQSQISPHRATPRRLALDHGPVAVLDGGSTAPGPARATAILVPGYPGSKEDFVPVLDLLAATGRRVVAVDQPGQFESPGPPEPTAYTIGWLGGVVRQIAAGLDDGPVHLLGHSFGGLVARAAVLAEPAMFRSLTLLGSGPGAINGERRARLDALEPLLPLGLAAVYQALEQLNTQVNPRWMNASPELRAFFRHRFLASSPAALKGMADALRSEPDQVAALRATGIPVLVCYGEQDDAWTPHQQSDMARRLGAREVRITGALHSPAVEQPTATSQALARFWADVEDGPQPVTS